jgi:hypothetical protein
MAKVVDPLITAAIADLTAAATAASTAITALKAQITTQMTPADVQAVHDQIETIAAALTTAAAP